MKKLVVSRIKFSALMLFMILALLIAPASVQKFVLAGINKSPQQLTNEFQLRKQHHRDLKSRLATRDTSLFQRSLAELSTLDEPGTLELWRTALSAEDLALKQQAWNEYEKVRLDLERKEFIPPIARINVSAEDLLQIANRSGLETDIWASANQETIAAAPVYLLTALSEAGIDYAVIYDSVVAFQQALKAGDRQAQAIDAARRAYRPETPTQVRIAVIDLQGKSSPAAGYSDWLGDRENVLMNNDRFTAYLDVFSSDGSADDISRHIEERYSKRGYSLACFYTQKEFSDKVQK